MKLMPLILGLAASSCVATSASERGTGQTEASSTMQETSPASPVLPTYAFSAEDPQDQAIIRGTLQMRGDCLVLARPEGDLLPIWPNGLSEWGSGSARLSFNGRSYRSGDNFAANGGEVAGMPAGVEASQVPAPCRNLIKAIIGTQSAG